MCKDLSCSTQETMDRFRVQISGDTEGSSLRSSKKATFVLSLKDAIKGSLYMAAVISVNSNFEFLEKNKYPVRYTVFAL